MQQPGGPGQPCPPGGPGRGAGILGIYDMVTKALPNQLGLTADQIEKFNKLVSANRTELQEVIKKLDAQRTKFDTDLNAILTPEQKAKLQELKDRKHQMMKNMMPGMGKGMGMEPDRPGMLLKALSQMNLPKDKVDKITEIAKTCKESFKNAKGDPQARRKIMSDMMSQIEKVLTSEEFQKLKDTMRTMAPKGQGHMGMGMGMGHMGGQMMGPGQGGRQHRGMGKGMGPGMGRGMGPQNCPTTCPAPCTTQPQDSSSESLW
jgi:Spy/CpxP family protein refolding chaperone